jgi:DUF4097 and DUF4098 domain-containing protein YvlB
MEGNERKRILALVESGTITAEEAIKLFEKLEAESNVAPTIQAFTSSEEKPSNEQSSTPNEKTEPHASSKTEETQENEEKKTTTGFEDLFNKAFGDKETNTKFDDVMNELKKDLSEFGTRMSSLFNTTFSKVKGFEADVPFGEKVEFKKSFAFKADEVSGIDFDLPNSKIEVQKATDELVTLEVSVKTKLVETEEETEKAFFEGFTEVIDGKLLVKTPSKFSQVQAILYVPEKAYDVFFVKALNSDVKVDALKAKVIKISLANGPIQVRHSKFLHADLSSKNGSIETRFVTGDDLEVETINGRIYIEGDLREVEAESINGHVVVTTTSEKAHKVKAATVAGTVELYIPKTVAIDGKLSTNFGKIDLGLNDVAEKQDEESILQKVTHFDKVLANAPLLKLVGESKTGSLIVRYNPSNS